MTQIVPAVPRFEAGHHRSNIFAKFGDPFFQPPVCLDPLAICLMTQRHHQSLTRLAYLPAIALQTTFISITTRTETLH